MSTTAICGGMALDEERTMVQNAYGEDEGTCEIANGSSLKVEKKKFGVVWMKIS